MICFPLFIYLKKIKAGDALSVELDVLSACLVSSRLIIQKQGRNLPSIFWAKQPIFQPIVYLKTHETQHMQLNKPPFSFKFAKIWSKKQKKNQHRISNLSKL